MANSVELNVMGKQLSDYFAPPPPSHLPVFLLNWSTLKGMNLLPMGADSFLLELTLFHKWLNVLGSKQEVTNIVFLFKNGGKSAKCI